MERMLGAELTAHLGYEVGAEPPLDQTNRRNGVATKRVKGPMAKCRFRFRATGMAASSPSW